MEQDVDHIRLISIFHYVVAGIAGLFSCFPIFHLAMGISMLAGGFLPIDIDPDVLFPSRLLGLMFTIIPAALILLGWVFTVCLAVAGYFLSKHKHYTFCLVMAGVACIFTPFGTALGVFTLVVLLRPAVKELFKSASATEPPVEGSA